MQSSSGLTITELVDWVNREMGLSSDEAAAEDIRPVTRRTVYYYINEGLLPPAEGSGTGSAYGLRHQLLLKLIKLYQQAHMPLRKIKDLLDNRLQDAPLEELQELVARLDQRQARAEVLESRVEDPAEQEAGAFWNPASADGPEPLVLCASLDPSMLEEEPVWRRAELAPGVELHYQLTGNRRWESFLERFVTDSRLKLRGKHKELDRNR